MVRVDNVTINTAQFQDNNNRWNIGGDCSDPGETITVYLGLFSLGTPLLGSDVCAADGTWKVNGVLGQTAAAGDVISVVSTGGAIFEGFPVTIR